MGKEFKPFEGDIFSSSLLNHIVRTLPTIREKATDFLSAINIKSARENDEANLWQDPDKYPAVQDAKDVRRSPLIVWILADPPVYCNL